MSRLALAAALLLAGCNKPIGKDGYAFEAKEYDRTEIAVTVVEHPDLGSLQTAAAARGVAAENIAAWSVLKADRPACEVHIVDPAKRWQPEYLGHEIAHCFWGRWHG